MPEVGLRVAADPTFKLNIHLEAFGPTGEEGWVGRVLTTSLSDTVALPPMGADDAIKLRKLLSPWQWQAIEWGNPADPVTEMVAPGECQAADAYLEALFAAGEWSYLDLAADTADEAMPLWPGLLAQWGRLGHQLSRPLNLTGHWPVAAAPMDGDMLRILAITVDGERYPISTDDAAVAVGKIEVRLETEKIYRLTGDRKGLIDHETRMVHASPQDKSSPHWLAELPVRLGKAISPLARLADIQEGASAPRVIGKDDVEHILRQLFSGHDDIGAILRSIAGLDAGLGEADLDVFANAWTMAFNAQIDGLTNQLLARLTNGTGLQPSVRQVMAKKDFQDDIRTALVDTLPIQPAPTNQIVRKWIQENADRFLHELLPQALARQRFMPNLIRAVGQEKDDWGPLQEHFLAAYMEEMAKLKLVDPAKTPVQADKDNAGIGTAAAKAVFHIEGTTVDAAAREGVPFRVDTIFSAASETIDIHTILDGYLAAVRWRNETGEKGKFELASQANLSIQYRGLKPDQKQQQAQVTTTLGMVYTPLPVTFEGLAGEARETDTRSGAASYQGEPLMPWSPRDRMAPGETVEAFPIEMTYTPARTDHLVPAYGLSIDVVCGFQAPGGLLGALCHADGDPLTFRCDALDGLESNHPFVNSIQVRRTMLPGAPRLSAPGPDPDLPPNFTTPAQANVRPLWREHLRFWPSRKASEAAALRDVPTLFMDRPDIGIGDSQARHTFSFIARPPVLALGEPKTGVTTGRILRYWQERDRHWRGEVGQPLAAPTTSHVEDPAVVGLVEGHKPGKGGIFFRLLKITRDGSEAAWERPVAVILGQGQSVTIDVSVTDGAHSPDPDAADLAAHHLLVKVPRGTRHILEIHTMCDERFLSGGSDARFAEGLGWTEMDGRKLAGVTRLAIEALPGVRHLPGPADLWKAIDVTPDDDMGNITARFVPPPTADADYIGDLAVRWQTWHWDGGPVTPYTAPEFALAANQLEGMSEDETRAAGHVAFERHMFDGRLDKGAPANRQCGVGTATELFRIEGRPNRGADYLRIRLTAKSRYADLRLGMPGLSESARMDPGEAAKGLRELELWRAFTIGVRRRDPLPTPRVSVAVPLFGQADREKVAVAGGIGLCLDHGMYGAGDGGLDDQLEIAIEVEKVETSGGEKLAALAVGNDPILTADVDPFQDDGHKPAPIRTETIDQGEITSQVLKAHMILGQTLQPQSPEPQFRSVIAMVEPVIQVEGNGNAFLRPNVMAKIVARRRVGGRVSPPSAPMWVHFLPDMGGEVDGKALYTATADETGIVLRASQEPGIRGYAEPRFKRLLDVCASADIGNPADGPHLKTGLLAAGFHAVTDVEGKERLRFDRVATGAFMADGIRFTFSAGKTPDHLRILEVQSVREPGATPFPEQAGGGELTERLFGKSSLVITAEPTASHDIGMRITGVGPLVKVQRVP
ncbi:hypothetical protein [Niveispirillum sp. KHB5.9]|uniref:hypothetical protein n=1 Tax=Niveispirillum sp. KHB5.9 TaxID=3400269 RepID=UPI003A83D6CE